MDKHYYFKRIIKHLGIILLAALILGLWFYLVKTSLIPFVDSINELIDIGLVGVFILVMSIILFLCFVIVIFRSLYKVLLSVNELLMLITRNDESQLTTDMAANDAVNAFNLTSHLNKQISDEARNAIVRFYNDNKKNRNKGLLLACVIEYMCDKGWINNIEPGYQSLEDFFKNELSLESVGFQQLDKSHVELKDIIHTVKMFNEGKGGAPSDKDQLKAKLYEKFIEYMNERVDLNRK